MLDVELKCFRCYRRGNVPWYESLNTGTAYFFSIQFSMWSPLFRWMEDLCNWRCSFREHRPLKHDLPRRLCRATTLRRDQHPWYQESEYKIMMEFRWDNLILVTTARVRLHNISTAMSLNMRQTPLLYSHQRCQSPLRLCPKCETLHHSVCPWSI